MPIRRRSTKNDVMCFSSIYNIPHMPVTLALSTTAWRQCHCHQQRCVTDT